MLTVGSLFSGIGGLELGLERTGSFKTIWHSEIDKYASAVLKKHWPDVPNLGDITKVDWNGIEKPDIICGGFPCQDISIAGKGAGIKEGTRSGLWLEYAKCIRALRPKYVIVENVPMLVKRGLHTVLADLAETGYDAEWHNISAASVGAWHKRERIFIIAHSTCAGKEPTQQPRQWNGFKQNGKDVPNSRSLGHKGKDFGGLRTEQNGPMGEEEQDKRRKRAEFGDGCEIPNTDGSGLQGCGQAGNPASEGKNTDELVARLRKSNTIWSVEPDVGRVAHGIPNRVDRIKCLGNAVVPQVAQVVGEMILQMEKNPRAAQGTRPSADGLAPAKPVEED